MTSAGVLESPKGTLCLACSTVRWPKRTLAELSDSPLTFVVELRCCVHCGLPTISDSQQLGSAAGSPSNSNITQTSGPVAFKGPPFLWYFKGKPKKDPPCWSPPEAPTQSTHRRSSAKAASSRAQMLALAPSRRHGRMTQRFRKDQSSSAPGFFRAGRFHINNS